MVPKHEVGTSLPLQPPAPPPLPVPSSTVPPALPTPSQLPPAQSSSPRQPPQSSKTSRLWASEHPTQLERLRTKERLWTTANLYVSGKSACALDDDEAAPSEAAPSGSAQRIMGVRDLAHVSGESAGGLSATGGEGKARNTMGDKGWSAEEDRLIMAGVARYGQKWRTIAQALPGRSDYSVRHRWTRLLLLEGGSCSSKKRSCFDELDRSQTSWTAEELAAVDELSRKELATSPEGMEQYWQQHVQHTLATRTPPSLPGLSTRAPASHEPSWVSKHLDSLAATNLWTSKQLDALTTRAESNTQVDPSVDRWGTRVPPSNGLTSASVSNSSTGEVVTEAQGFELYLSSRGSTPYLGVSTTKSNPPRFKATHEHRR